MTKFSKGGGERTKRSTPPFHWHKALTTFLSAEKGRAKSQGCEQQESEQGGAEQSTAFENLFREGYFVEVEVVMVPMVVWVASRWVSTARCCTWAL